MERMLPLFSRAFKSTRGEDGNPVTAELLSSTRKSGTIAIIGQKQTCKTSLLFQAGIVAAKEGLHATFIRPEPFSCLPLRVHGMPVSDPESLALISMRYPSTAKDFTDYLGSLHEEGSMPDLLIVDDLHVYLQMLQKENGQEEGDGYEFLARLCCLLEDAVDFMAVKGNTHSPRLLVSSCDSNPTHMPIYEKYLKDLVKVEAAYPMSGENGVSVSWSTGDNRISVGLTLCRDVIYPSVIDVRKSGGQTCYLNS